MSIYKNNPALLRSNSSIETIGLIGLGLVGNSVAQRLKDAGYSCVGFDISDLARSNFENIGFTAAKSVKEVISISSLIILTVYDTSGVIQVINEAIEYCKSHEFIATSKKIHIIDCSTGDPEKLETLDLQLEGSPINLIEAPLSGSSEQIKEGTSTMLLGGESTNLENVSDILNCISSNQIRVGKVGMAARAKLATNLVLGLNRAAFAEGMIFAEKMGIDRDTFLNLVLQTPARSDAAVNKGLKMVREDYLPQSRIRQHLKDVELMIAAASKKGQRLPLSETHATLMKSAVANGDGDLDNAAIIRQIQREFKQ